MDYVCTSVFEGGGLDRHPKAGDFGTAAKVVSTRRGRRANPADSQQVSQEAEKQCQVKFCSRPPPGLGVRDGALSSSQEPLSFATRVSFASWVGGLLRAVLRTRTPFSLFLNSTLHLPRPAGPAQPSRVGSSVIFPLPMNAFGAFEHFPLECGSRFRRRLSAWL